MVAKNDFLRQDAGERQVWGRATGAGANVLTHPYHPSRGQDAPERFRGCRCYTPVPHGRSCAVWPQGPDILGPGWRHCSRSSYPGWARPISACVAGCPPCAADSRHRGGRRRHAERSRRRAQRAVEQLPGRGHRGEHPSLRLASLRDRPCRSLAARRGSGRAAQRDRRGGDPRSGQPGHARLGGVVVAQLDDTLQQVFGEPLAEFQPAPDPVESGETPDARPEPVNQPLFRWDGTERINVLLVGTDAHPSRDAVLTDVLLVVSVDPVEETAVMISVPRDTGFVPLPRRVPLRRRPLSGQGQRAVAAGEPRPGPMVPGPGSSSPRPAVSGRWSGRSGCTWGSRSITTRSSTAGFAELIDALGGLRLGLPGALRSGVRRDAREPRRRRVAGAARGLQ